MVGKTRLSWAPAKERWPTRWMKVGKFLVSALAQLEVTILSRSGGSRSGRAKRGDPLVSRTCSTPYRNDSGTGDSRVTLGKSCNDRSQSGERATASKAVRADGVEVTSQVTVRLSAGSQRSM